MRTLHSSGIFASCILVAVGSLSACGGDAEVPFSSGGMGGTAGSASLGLGGSRFQGGSAGLNRAGQGSTWAGASGDSGSAGVGGNASSAGGALGKGGEAGKRDEPSNAGRGGRGTEPGKGGEAGKRDEPSNGGAGGRGTEPGKGGEAGKRDVPGKGDPMDGGSGGGAPEPPDKSGDPIGACPESVPTAKSECEGKAECSYPGVTCECERAGDVSHWRCEGSGEACPDQTPEHGAACVRPEGPEGLNCPYPDGEWCRCTGAGTWECASTVCPTDAPLPDDACQLEDEPGSRLECDYGKSSCVCLKGSWMCLDDAPPRP